MNCQLGRNLIEKQVAGVIEPGELDALREHAGGCPACAAELDKADNVEKFVRVAFRPTAETGASRGRVLSALRKPSAPWPDTRSFAPYRWALPAMAAALVLVSLLLGLWAAGLLTPRPKPSPAKPTVAVPPPPAVEVRTPLPAEVQALTGKVEVKHRWSEAWEPLTMSSSFYQGDLLRSAAGATAILSLKDEAKVTLSAESAISLDRCDSVTELGLTQGSVRSAVAPQRVPFSITTPDGRIEAVGTDFTVTVEPEERSK